MVQSSNSYLDSVTRNHPKFTSSKLLLICTHLVLQYKIIISDDQYFKHTKTLVDDITIKSKKRFETISGSVMFERSYYLLELGLRKNEDTLTVNMPVSYL